MTHRPKTQRKSVELDDRDAGASELHVLITERAHAGDGGEIGSDDLAQRTGAGAVKDAHLVLLKLNRLIDEIGNGSHGFRGTHAAQVNLGFELQFLLPF